MTQETQPETVIIGAGLAGLACGIRLNQLGISCRLLEASDGVGGRVRTDRVEGFLLDRGFQVLLDAYPEARHHFDYRALDLRTFVPGAIVRCRGAFHRVADPRRAFMIALGSLLNPVGTLGDKLRVGRLVRQARAGEFDSVFEGAETSVESALGELGFSARMVDTFFRPFLGGILLDASLSTSSYMLDFVIRMMAEGETCVPAGGMGQLSEQLAAKLGRDKIQLGARVEAVDEAGVRLEGGERLEAERVVIAVEGPEASRLLGEKITDPGSRGVTCLYFAAEQSPVEGPWLVLNGEGASDGPVNNLAVMSEVSSSYAPVGKHLIAATVLGIDESGDEALEASVRRQLRGWYGGPVDGWRALKTYRIHHAQPGQPPGFRGRHGSQQLDGRVYVCGDHTDSASIQGALGSGRQVAEAIATSR